MEINLSQEAMIEPAKYGIPQLAILSIPFKVTKMQYIVWRLMFLMVQELLQDPSIKLLKFGIHSQENAFQLTQDIRDKLSQ